MRHKLPLLLLLSASLSLSGCVAALVPLAAAGALGKTQIDRTKAGKKFVESGAVKVASPIDLAASAPGVGTINTAQLDDESQKYLDSITRFKLDNLEINKGILYLTLDFRGSVFMFCINGEGLEK